MAQFERTSDEDRLTGGWRAIGSAWLMALLVVALFAGFSALSARCATWDLSYRRPAQLVVPRHDPAIDPRAVVAAPPV
jgi:hypothetical protein